MGTVLSIHISNVRGIDKSDVTSVHVLNGWGLAGDAHGGDWDRQVSIFPVEALKKVPADKRDEVLKGGYTENFTITGVAVDKLKVGTRVQLGSAVIEILQIGKEQWEDHGRPYIVSREGRFGRVVTGGEVRVGDRVSVIL
jgi:MOSC domain-containing protein YiiM